MEEMSAQELIRISGCSLPGLRGLEKKGYIVLRERVLQAAEDVGDAQALQYHLTFTPEQQNAYNVILKKLALPAPGVILLHGVTSSGKTEIYLQAIAKVIEQGRKAIFLVPEISLTSQTIQRIKSRFHHVAVLHSHLLGGISLLTMERHQGQQDRHSNWRALLYLCPPVKRRPYYY